MGKAHLIDSNAVIDFLGNKLPATGRVFLQNEFSDPPQISVVTQIEILGFPHEALSLQITQLFIDQSEIHPLNDDVVLRAIDLRQRQKIKLADSIIAATALIHGKILVTRNVSDFKNIPGLRLIDPHRI